MTVYAAVDGEKFNKAIEAMYPEIIKSINKDIEQKKFPLVFEFISNHGNQNIKEELLSICKYFNNQGYCACVIEQQYEAKEVFNVVIGEVEQA